MTIAGSALCRNCNQPLGPGLFCQYCGVFILDPRGTVVMASRMSRLGAAIVNALLMIFTLFIGWVIWWFIVAPRGQNPGKAVVGLRVIYADGRAAKTGSMLLRGLATFITGLIPLYLDELWLLWDRDAQTLHDKLVSTVVVKAAGSEHVVDQGSGGPLPEGVRPPPPYAPPVTFPTSSQTPGQAQPPAEAPGDALRRLQGLRDQGLITEEEYDRKRHEILDRL